MEGYNLFLKKRILSNDDNMWNKNIISKHIVLIDF